jgi:hypothetical protein
MMHKANKQICVDRLFDEIIDHLNEFPSSHFVKVLQLSQKSP